MRRVTLRPGRDGPVRAGHPWIFSRAIAGGMEGAEPGEPVAVCAAGGQFVAAGYCHPTTTIAVRVLTLEDEPIDGRLVARRVEAAIALRSTHLPAGLTAYRVVNGEGDGLPGMIADRYGDFVVIQLLTAGAVRLGAAFADALEAQLAPRGIFERSEGAVRAEEGVAGARGVVRGEAPPPRLVIDEEGCRFLVDVEHGQKTGFFLDQRVARGRVRALADGKRVLNAFSYTGAFAIAAALGGAAHVTSIDTSRPALTLAEAAWAENGLAPERATWTCGDVFDVLREGRERFDLIVLDPPPFIRRRRDVVPGLRGYRDVNLQAFRRLEPDGLLVTASCSQHLSRHDFREVVASAAADAGRPPTVVAEWGHGPDHPVALAHREGEYLKVLLLRA